MRISVDVDENEVLNKVLYELGTDSVLDLLELEAYDILDYVSFGSILDTALDIDKEDVLEEIKSRDLPLFDKVLVYDPAKLEDVHLFLTKAFSSHSMNNMLSLIKEEAKKIDWDFMFRKII